MARPTTTTTAARQSQDRQFGTRRQTWPVRRACGQSRRPRRAHGAGSPGGRSTPSPSRTLECPAARRRRHSHRRHRRRGRSCSRPPWGVPRRRRRGRPGRWTGHRRTLQRAAAIQSQPPAPASAAAPGREYGCGTACCSQPPCAASPTTGAAAHGGSQRRCGVWWAQTTALATAVWGATRAPWEATLRWPWCQGKGPCRFCGKWQSRWRGDAALPTTHATTGRCSTHRCVMRQNGSSCGGATVVRPTSSPYCAGSRSAYTRL